ncbi:glutathione-s-transferase theta, gst, putative [Ricinus communis]|uniref:Glutathione-s-transferase theta, gst, putative n=1 Tax=Ricinus communis TaxID=3988 RepID=B9TB28_RICCO|nr:glutathione-s-transferase theta, gst, putative [Ricinus communis]
MIDLYGCGSPNVLKVLLMLEELALPYRLHKVNVHHAEQYRPELLALNPNNKVPFIVDNDAEGGPHTVIESGAILFYLAEKTGRLFGQTLLQRSEIMQWLMWQMGGVGPMFGQALHFQYIAAEGNDYARKRYLTEVKRLYDVAEQRLSQSAWLGGGEYSIADIAAWPWLAKYYNYKGFERRLSDFPNLSRWITAIEQRPAYGRIHELFKALFKEDLGHQQTASADELDHFFGRGRYFRA